jgi:hypothetical protein
MRRAIISGARAEQTTLVMKSGWRRRMAKPGSFQAQMGGVVVTADGKNTSTRAKALAFADVDAVRFR